VAQPSPPTATARFEAELDTLIRARYPLISLVSWEEQRMDELLHELAARHGKALLTWSVTRGLGRVGGARMVPAFEGSRDPAEVLGQIGKLTEPSLVVLKDFHPYLNDAGVIRALRELAQQLKQTFTTVILLSPVLSIPVELEKELSVLDVPLPTYDDLEKLLREIVVLVLQGKRARVELTPQETEALIKAAQGLTLSEAENAFAKAIAQDGVLDGRDIALVLDEKRQVIRKSGLLEFVPVEEGLGNVGGLEGLKAWLGQRASAFTDAARQFGLPAPKGLLLLGVQGCGKSLTAKATAAEWSLPLLRLDMGRIFSGIVGSSEDNMRKAIRVAESVAPAVLWVDEIEKGLSGVASSGSTDGGVTARVFSSLLTWLQEKTAPVFVVATANRVEALPPELLRKGRFDEIFFIDLPSAEEREEILRIHLRHRGRDPAGFDIVTLARAAEGFSGAELEQVVVAGLFDAFAAGEELSQEHLVYAIRATFPLSTTMGEDIERIRDWSKQRTRPAAGPRLEPVSPIATRFG
jgi:hypothetical protein